MRWKWVLLGCCVGLFLAACDPPPPKWSDGYWKPKDAKVENSEKCVLEVECVMEPYQVIEGFGNVYTQWRDAKNPRVHVNPAESVMRPGVTISDPPMPGRYQFTKCREKERFWASCKWCVDRIDCTAQGLDARTRKANCCIP
jgi:hypothetical protein